MNRFHASSKIPVVFITGFGPFRSIKINPSWQVAQALQTFVDWPFPIRLILEQFSVVYDEIRQKIPSFWNKYSPTLVVHLGVASGTNEIRCESCASSIDYCHEDNNGCLPTRERSSDTDRPSMLTTHLPLDRICHRLENRTKIPVIISNDAGRYLCEFLYYQSLLIDPYRTIFIHIPDLNDGNITVENLAETIQMIIEELLCYVQR